MTEEVFDSSKRPSLGDETKVDEQHIGVEETPPADGIKVTPHELVGLKETTKTSFIEISPGAASPLKMYLGERTITDTVAFGTGFFLGLDPEGKVYYTKFKGDGNEAGTFIEYGKGWIIMWKAAKDGKGLSLIESPPGGNEYQSLVGDEELLLEEFKELLKQLKDL